MRGIEKVQVERAIVHQVDSGPSGLRMSGRELQLDAAPRLIDFLAGHIRNGLQDSQAKAAVWSSTNSGGTPGACQALLNGTLDLVTASQELAVALHTAIGNDQRIARGALTVVIFHDGAVTDRDAERFVALVKLDPSGVFLPEWHTDAGGISYLSVSELADALPTLRERLQKCAFVRAARPGDGYHLLVLDRQMPEVSAKFFMKDFLHARLALDERALTEGLYRAMRIARRRLENTLPVNRLMELDKAIQGVFAATAVDLGEWLRTQDQAVRDAIDAEVRRQELDWAFDLDPDTKVRLAGKVHYRGDDGLEVQFGQDAYGETVQVVEGDSRNPRRYRVTIDTSEWRLG